MTATVGCPDPGCEGSITTRYYATGPGRPYGERLPYMVCDNPACDFNIRRPRDLDDG